jgi:hypothetical protein
LTINSGQQSTSSYTEECTPIQVTYLIAFDFDVIAFDFRVFAMNGLFDGKILRELLNVEQLR